MSLGEIDKLHSELLGAQARIAELEAALADILNMAVPVLTGGHQSRALSEIWQIVHKALGKDPVNG